MAFVLIHGATFAGSCWRYVVPLLNAPALAVDLPGRASKPGDLAHQTYEGWARSVLADMDAAGIQRATFVGHSLGGATLVTLARLAPERIGALVFLAAPVPPDTNFRREDLLARNADSSGALPFDPMVEPVKGIFTSDLDTEAAREMLADRVRESFTILIEPVSLEGLRRTMRCHYIRIAEDKACPPAIQDATIARLRQHCPVDVIPLAGGHMPMYSRPRALADILNAIH